MKRPRRRKFGVTRIETENSKTNNHDRFKSFIYIYKYFQENRQTRKRGKKGKNLFAFIVAYEKQTFSEYSPKRHLKKKNEFPLKGPSKRSKTETIQIISSLFREKYRNQKSQKRNRIQISSKKSFEQQKFQATPDEFSSKIQLQNPEKLKRPIKNRNRGISWKWVKFRCNVHENGEENLHFFNQLQRSRTWNFEKHTFFCTLFQALWNLN